MVLFRNQNQSRIFFLDFVFFMVGHLFLRRSEPFASIEQHTNDNLRKNEREVQMRLLRGVITGGGIAAFFFFSWILELLWNSILFEQLGLVPTAVTYWQAAGLWFFVIILFAWVGIGNPSGFGSKWRKHC